MRQTLAFFPEINGDLLNEMKVKVNYNFLFFSRSHELREIKTRTDSNIIAMIPNPNDVEFNKFKDDLYVRIIVTYENGILLYGENGVAPLDSELSICLECFSQKDRFRHVQTIKNAISKDETKRTEIIEFVVPKSTVGFDLNFNLYCYLSKSSSQLREGEDILNNKEGVVLGDLGSKKLCFLGQCSLFPVYGKPDEHNKNLWELKIEYDDPEKQTVSDCVRLILNTKHKDYKFLDQNNKHYCDSLIVNIIINSVTILITSLIEELGADYIFKNQETFDPDTLIGFVQYFKKNISTKDNLNDVASIAKAVRNFVYERED